jgi:hypothetical protein
MAGNSLTSDLNPLLAIMVHWLAGKRDVGGMAREDFVAWLRNGEKQPWALLIPYKQAGVWKGCYPDFPVFRRKGNHLVVDIIDPHHTSMEDSPSKAAALASFADEHRDSFGRIDLIVVAKAGKPDERVKRLRLMDQKARKKVMAVCTQLTAAGPLRLRRLTRTPTARLWILVAYLQARYAELDSIIWRVY